MKSSRTRIQEVCRANSVTFNKAELPRPWDSLGAVRAASGRINIQASEKILRKVLCFLCFFCEFQVWSGGVRGNLEKTLSFLVFSGLPLYFLF